MPVLPHTLDANVNNPTTFPSFSGGKRKRTRKTRKMRRTRKTRKNNNKYCARICVSKRNLSMGYTIDKQKLD